MCLNLKKREKTIFGNYLVKQIKMAGMSQEEFYNMVGIKKPYFYDILISSPPSVALQNKILDVLDEKMGKDINRRREMYDIAAFARNEIPADIEKLIIDNPKRINEIRNNLVVLLNTEY